ncbi:T9SS type A sorting domain-containing protein, partial [candidate division WOR-3 bacterium]|nr:T9SS type A sorting domain-containing protein [candidate division WOR-3 bacterium]
DTLDNGDEDEAFGIAVDGSGNVYVTGRSNIGGDEDYLTVKYAKYKDAGILSIVSPPDTVSIDTTYIPGILVRNNSYENTVDIDVVAFIDSAGIHIYSDLQSIYNLTSGDSTTVSFTQWDTPSNPMDLTLRFFIITPDINPANDTISKTLYVKDLVPPVIDSAVAFDGVNAVPGIDDDDYVILYFSEPTNKPTIDNTNINSVLSFSGGHSWLDGMGIVGICGWNLNGDQLTINLTTNTSLPTIAVGDTITPDGVTITDVNGNFCSSPVVLGGSFDPTGIADRNLINKTFLNVYTINKDKISFSYGIKKLAPYKITLYTIDGRMIKSIEGEENGYHEEQFSGLPSGIYFLRLSQGNDIIGRKVVLIR